MKTPRVYKTEGIVLRHRKLGEADKVLTIYTPRLGKLEAVAKGVRRPTSRLAGHVEVLTRTSLLLAHGRTLDVVTQAQELESSRPLWEDLERLGWAAYAAELVDRCTPERQEHEAVYRLLLETLRRLRERDDLDLVLRYFEVQLLALLGYRPHLDACVSCGEPLRPLPEPGAPGATNYYSPSAGGATCPECGRRETAASPLSVNGLKVLRLFQRSGFQEAARVRLTPELGRELERHLRSSIRFILERDVRATEFLDRLRRGTAPPPRAAALPGAGTADV